MRCVFSKVSPYCIVFQQLDPLWTSEDERGKANRGERPLSSSWENTHPSLFLSQWTHCISLFLFHFFNPSSCPAGQQRRDAETDGGRRCTDSGMKGWTDVKIDGSQLRLWYTKHVLLKRFFHMWVTWTIHFQVNTHLMQFLTSHSFVIALIA